jgi:hypothetical protein
VTTSHEWDHGRGLLRVTADPSDDGAVRLAAQAHATVDQDDCGTVLDVDVIGLPALVLPHLRQYRAQPGTPMPPSGIAHDLDAAWLWVHLAGGPRAHRIAGLVLVSLCLSDRGLCRIEVRFLGEDGPKNTDDAASHAHPTTTN